MIKHTVHENKRNHHLIEGTGHNKFVQRRSTLSPIVVLSKTPSTVSHVINITDISVALKFELTQKFLAGKSQHCWMNQGSDTCISSSFFTAGQRSGYAIKTPSFEVKEGE